MMEVNWPEAHPVTLSADEVHVHIVPLDAVRAESDSLWGVLSDEERQRAAQFHFEAPRRRFVFARAALRALLGKYSGTPAEAIEFARRAHGKPRLGRKHNHNDLRFNVAHSGDLALVAVASGCEVGVDVEQLRTVGHLSQIARRYFHPAERDAILAAPPSARDAAFLRCWTLKEAVLKAVGSGITGSLAGFCVPLDSADSNWIELPMQSSGQSCRCWLQRIVPGEDYTGAVACVGAERYPRCFIHALY
jgi:4'-phosphopantetheinyl transferase